MCACFRVLRAAARLVLCLALVLLPIASVSAEHIDSATAVTQGHGRGHGPESSSTDEYKPLCHQTGAYFGFLAPTAPRITPAVAFGTLDIPAMPVPTSAAVHLLLRPPIAIARA